MKTNEEKKPVGTPDGNKTKQLTRPQIQQKRYYRPQIKEVRFVLIILAIFYTYSIRPDYEDYNAIIFGFSIPAVYIFSGYLVLRKSEHIGERIRRTIGRTALCFFILFASYLGLSLLVDPTATCKLLTQKSFWLDFLLLNVCNLPIGSSIWFVQAELYAYIIIYIFYKLKLLRFDIYIAAIFLAVTLLTGELGSLVGFSLWGHKYLIGNFFNRALPYILIGGFIHRKKRALIKLRKKGYWGLFVAGMLFSVGEYLLLYFSGNKIYVGHLFGMGISAIGLSLWCFFALKTKLRFKSLKNFSRFELTMPYYICAPIVYFFTKWLDPSTDPGNSVTGFVVVMTVTTCILFMYFYALLRHVYRKCRQYVKMKKIYREKQNNALSAKGK